VHRDQAVELTSVRTRVQASEKDRRVLESPYGIRVPNPDRVQAESVVRASALYEPSGFSFACWRSCFSLSRSRTA
jgi:hypothetical protein